MLLRRVGSSISQINTWKYHWHNCLWVFSHQWWSVQQGKSKGKTRRLWSLQTPQQHNTQVHTNLRIVLLPDVEWTQDHMSCKGGLSSLYTSVISCHYTCGPPATQTGSVWTRLSHLVMVVMEIPVGSREQIRVLLVVNFYQTRIVQN